MWQKIRNYMYAGEVMRKNGDYELRRQEAGTTLEMHPPKEISGRSSKQWYEAKDGCGSVDVERYICMQHRYNDANVTLHGVTGTFGSLSFIALVSI
jgi:hypothetical protein